MALGDWLCSACGACEEHGDAALDDRDNSCYRSGHHTPVWAPDRKEARPRCRECEKGYVCFSK